MDSHEHACQHHTAPSSGPCAPHGCDASHLSAEAATCGGAGPCGGTADCAATAGAGASCGHCTSLGMPTTDERVTLPANDLATLLDLVEAFAGSSYDEDGAYTRSDAALRAQAPNLVAAREQLLATFREMAGRAIQEP